MFYKARSCCNCAKRWATESKGRTLGGESKTVKVDGGYVKPTNMPSIAATVAYKSIKRQAHVMIVRERNGNSVPVVFRTEGEALISSARAS